MNQTMILSQLSFYTADNTASAKNLKNKLVGLRRHARQKLVRTSLLLALASLQINAFKGFKD